MPSSEALQRLVEDRASRLAVSQQVPLHQLSGEPTELCPSGCVTVVAGTTNSDLFQKVQDALAANDQAALNSAIVEARTDARAGQPMSDGEAAEAITSLPSYAEIRYLGKTLIPYVSVTEAAHFVRFFLPFAGGPLEASDFQATHFLQQPDTAPFEVLVVAHAPRLSNEDLALIERIPAASREMLIGDEEVLMGTPVALVATLTAAAVGVGVGIAIGHALQHFNAEVFAELETTELANASDLKDLQPTAAVQELIAAKRKALATL